MPVGPFSNQILIMTLETTSIIYNRGDLIQGMSYTGEGRAVSPSDGEVTQRLATARRNCAAAKSETWEEIMFLGLGGPLVTLVTQSLSSFLQKELLKAAFLIRHLQSFPHPTDSPSQDVGQS